MTSARAILCNSLCVLASLLALSTRALAKDERCEALFEQGASELAAERYAKMLQIAEDRMRLCPDAQSAFLLGLAQANMVDRLVVSDPAEREQIRLSALRNLRVAAAGGELKTVWQFTVHDWIVHLLALGPAEEPSPGVQAPLSAAQLSAKVDEANAEETLEPLHVPPAPPPQAQPKFPWGPALTGTLGLGALVTGIVLDINAADSRREARSAANQLRILKDELDPQTLSDGILRTKALNDAADTKARWSTICLVGSAAAMIGAIVWYFALPPKGKWRWAALPTQLQTTVRF
jgi:hypothetical protein